MNKYQITVVIATYNSGNYLNEFMESMKKQSIGFQNIEIIFVDDNSSDENTLNLLKQLDKSYDNVCSVFLDVNSGFPGTGRNVGLNLSNSDYIIFCDHDDTYVENAFEVMLNKIGDNDMLISNFNQVFPDKLVPFKSIYRDTPEIQVSKISVDKNLFRVPAAIWTRLFRKKFLQDNNIKFLEGMLAEDVYVAVNASICANGIIYLNNFYSYNYKIRDNDNDKSTIHLRNRKYIESILNGYYEIDRLLQELNKTSYGKIIFKNHLTSWLYMIVLSNLSDNDKKQLFTKAHSIFIKYYSNDPYFKKRYDKLANLILDGKFDEAVLESNKLKRFQINMNNTGFVSRLKNKLKRLL